MLRMDAAIARMCVLQASGAHIKHTSGRQLEPADFMPFPVEEEATPEQMVAAMTGRKING